MKYETKGVILQIENVSLDLGGRPILRQVSGEIRDIVRPDVTQGQVVCLLGPSGVGKTQLFRLLAGLGSPDSGVVKVTYRDQLMPVQRGMVGVVSQGSVIFRHRTVLGNLLVAAKLGGLAGAEALKKANELLERFGIGDKGGFYPVELSGGQRQRVAIIQQLLGNKYFLLMDEPFSGLDLIAKDEVCKVIASVALADEMNTIIVTTHDVLTAAAIADTIWLVGRDRDENGKSLGARIQKIYDLAAMGLAWRPDIRELPEYHAVVNDISKDFKSL